MQESMFCPWLPHLHNKISNTLYAYRYSPCYLEDEILSNSPCCFLTKAAGRMVNGVTHKCPKLYRKDHFQFFSDLKGLSLPQGLKSSLPSHMDTVTEKNNFDPCRKKTGSHQATALQCQFPAKKIDPEPSRIIHKHTDT